MMHRFRYIVLVIFLLQNLLAAQSASRGAIHGRIQDAESGEGLPYSNVFLSNTTLGDAADENGDYVLTNIPPGSYQLVVSRIGYDIVVREIVVLPGKTSTLDLGLHVQSIKGEEISVVGNKDTRQWKRDLKEFTQYFIGETPNSVKCKILNSLVLDFEREPVTKNLLAYSDSILVVENRSLGYRIDIVLSSFKWGHFGGQYIIYPKYTALEPKNEREQKRWNKSRKEAFRSSMRDFFASLALNEHEKDYSVYQVKQGIAGHMNRGMRLDSLDVYVIDPARGMRRLENSGLVQIQRRAGGNTNIILKYDYIDFDPRGNIYPADGVTLYGFWGKYRVADTLPFDYWPDEQ